MHIQRKLIQRTWNDSEFLKLNLSYSDSHSKRGIYRLLQYCTYVHVYRTCGLDVQYHIAPQPTTGLYIVPNTYQMILYFNSSKFFLPSPTLTTTSLRTSLIMYLVNYKSPPHWWWKHLGQTVKSPEGVSSRLPHVGNCRCMRGSVQVCV